MAAYALSLLHVRVFLTQHGGLDEIEIATNSLLHHDQHPVTRPAIDMRLCVDWSKEGIWGWARSRNFTSLLIQKFLECVEVVSSQRSVMSTELNNELHNGSKIAENCSHFGYAGDQPLLHPSLPIHLPMHVHTHRKKSGAHNSFSGTQLTHQTRQLPPVWFVLPAHFL